jgi:very-short-patch-repair endonuclease
MYIQRPRFIAVSEFGPGALIYHEGSRYQVTRIHVPVDEPGEIATTRAWVCRSCGYLHGEETDADLCQNCGTSLAGCDKNNLMRLQTVFTQRRAQITSDEEERRRAGFRLRTTYRFSDHGARVGRADAQVLAADGHPLAELTYGDAATVRVINLGRRRGPTSKVPDGFPLDLTSGRWLSDKDMGESGAGSFDELPAAEDASYKMRVIPYAEDRRNILVVRLAEPVDDELAITFQYALERAIEARYQLEDAELTSEQLPDAESRGRVLLTESAEGGAGVLRRLYEDDDALAEVAREALEISHFSSDGREDRDHAPGVHERCEKACYDCLLSYGNQAYHRRVNRHAARGLLAELARATTKRAGVRESRDERLRALANQSPSALGKEFLAWLAKHGYRLPTRADEMIVAARARVDFVYLAPDGQFAVFLDGGAHATAHEERDDAAEERLWQHGWTVLRVRQDEEHWHRVAVEYPSVFGSGHGVR